MICLGTGSKIVADQLKKFGNVLFDQNKIYDKFLPEVVAPILTETIKNNKITHLVGANSNVIKNVFPRVAANLNVSQISDVIKIIDKDTFQRPIYAGLFLLLEEMLLLQ